MEDRRGFLKTLGKLAAAVGITTAAAGGKRVNGKELNHDEFMDALEKPFKMGVRTTSDVTPGGLPIRETFLYKPRSQGATRLASNSHTIARPEEIAMTPQPDRFIHQQLMDDTYNAMVDNAHMKAYPPQMVVSADQYDAIMKSQQKRYLDPYKWGDVFEIKWRPFRAKPDMYLYEGWWEAKVRTAFNRCFEGETFRVNVLIDGKLINSVKNAGNKATQQATFNMDRQMIVERKRAAYIKLVDELQRIIRQESGPDHLFENYNDDVPNRDLRKINGKFRGITD